MKNFSFENPVYLDMLNRQVVHMDQGACYNPEYMATRSMHDYPSRVAQIIRAVYLNELEATKYGSDIVFRSLLSGQGERWQNFGEDPYGYLYSQLLGRQLFAGKGLAPAYEPLPEADDHTHKLWADAILKEDGDTALLVDTANFIYAKESAVSLGRFLQVHGIKIAEYGPYDTGFSLMAHGLVKEGITRLAALVDGFAERGIRKVIAVSGLGHFSLGVMAKQLGIPNCPEVTDILDIAAGLHVTNGYIYSGSFYSRYLGYGQRLMELTPNSAEEQVANTWEFQPSVMGDNRMNIINIWESPLCAEFLQPPNDSKVTDIIFNNGADRIKKIPFNQLVVCEPFAYNTIIKKDFETEKLVYFWDLLA